MLAVGFLGLHFHSFTLLSSSLPLIAVDKSFIWFEETTDRRLQILMFVSPIHVKVISFFSVCRSLWHKRAALSLSLFLKDTATARTVVAWSGSDEIACQFYQASLLVARAEGKLFTVESVSSQFPEFSFLWLVIGLFCPLVELIFHWWKIVFGLSHLDFQERFEFA